MQSYHESCWLEMRELVFMRVSYMYVQLNLAVALRIPFCSCIPAAMEYYVSVCSLISVLCKSGFFYTHDFQSTSPATVIIIIIIVILPLGMNWVTLVIFGTLNPPPPVVQMPQSNSPPWPFQSRSVHQLGQSVAVVVPLILHKLFLVELKLLLTQ